MLRSGVDSFRTYSTRLAEGNGADVTFTGPVPSTPVEHRATEPNAFVTYVTTYTISSSEGSPCGKRIPGAVDES